MKEQKVTIDAPLNWTLVGTLYEADNPSNGPLVLMSSAAGVPQGYYSNFARYLVEEGARAVLTYDYRGMSLSAGDRQRWGELRMFHWGQLDFPSAAQFLLNAFPKHVLVGMGHSYGGQALGLSARSDLFARYATVATMSGYWRDLDTPYSVWFQTQIIGRFLAGTLGYIPKGLGVGEAMPGTIMKDWIRWIASPHYWFDDPDVTGTDQFGDVKLPYLSIRISDDPWGTDKAVHSFMKWYDQAQIEHRIVHPTASGPIGHLGYFRKRHRDEHWHHARDFLLGSSTKNSTVSIA